MINAPINPRRYNLFRDIGRANHVLTSPYTYRTERSRTPLDPALYEPDYLYDWDVPDANEFESAGPLSRAAVAIANLAGVSQPAMAVRTATPYLALGAAGLAGYGAYNALSGGVELYPGQESVNRLIEQEKIKHALEQQSLDPATIYGRVNTNQNPQYQMMY
jgi:hypothetical protein